MVRSLRNPLISLAFLCFGGCAAVHPRPPQEVPGGIRFEVVAPGARTVAVVGDFNRWDPRRGGLRPDPSAPGLWSAVLPIPPGLHRYKVLVDGARWMDPPHPSWTTPDGFGGENGMLMVDGEP